MPGNKKKKPHHDNEEKDFSPTPADTNQGLHQPYKGYDEEKTNNDQQGDYDVDENNINQRSGEYKDWNRDNRPE